MERKTSPLSRALINTAISIMITMVLFAVFILYAGEHPFARLEIYLIRMPLILLAGLIALGMAVFSPYRRTQPAIITLGMLNVVFGVYYFDYSAKIKLGYIDYIMLGTGICILNLLLWEVFQRSKKSEEGKNEKRPPNEQPLS